ncbi:GyrI-like domain-containing protein [Paenibacillus vini]|uniref:VOC domain-containing protein n=1 Tax=Paenibacillus vini TaxID=1476024 RepID=A0ABQ4MJH5_9BACL|nr:GyrI-like domain-containing protein [Paenibacillus vini]GIP56150.1 hypothetical protein J42TS3_51850 [Paenibacillus vini]
MEKVAPSVRKVHMESVTIVGMSCLTSKAHERKKSKIMKLGEQFWSRFEEIKNRLDQNTYGINIYPDHFSGSEMYEHMIGFRVDPSEEVPEGMEKRTFPAHLCAAVTNKGEIKNLFDTYGYVHSKWLPSSGYEYADQYDIQLYDSRFLGVDHPESELDIYIPIRPSAQGAVVHPESPVKGRIHAVFIPVRDLHVAKSWYSRILGLPESGEAINGHLYMLPLDGNVDIILDEMPMWREVGADGPPPYRTPAVMLSTENIKESYRFMQERGVHLVTEIQNDQWFVFLDPDGNHLMVCE